MAEVYKTPAVKAAELAARLKEEQDRKRQLEDEERVFSRAKQGLEAKTGAQSRLESERSVTQSALQRERSQQSIFSQQTGIEGNSRLQGERATQAIASQREGVEGNSRLQRERSDQSMRSQQTGIEGNSRLQRERADQGLRSQEKGTEGQSRIQKEGFEGRSKLQSQTAAEANARKAGDRAASMSLFRKFGKGR